MRMMRCQFCFLQFVFSLLLRLILHPLHVLVEPLQVLRAHLRDAGHAVRVGIDPLEGGLDHSLLLGQCLGQSFVVGLLRGKAGEEIVCTAKIKYIIPW